VNKFKEVLVLKKKQERKWHVLSEEASHDNAPYFASDHKNICCESKVL
jgi:hypothetical protein